MVWVKIDDHFTDNPKIEKLSDRAFRLHVAGLCYCGANLTDGFIPDARVRRLLPTVTKKMVAELIDNRVWLPLDGGFEVKDYLEYNPSKAKVEKDRAEADERRRRWKERRDATRDASKDASRDGTPTRPDPSRPEGPRDGSTGLAVEVEQATTAASGERPDTRLPDEVVDLARDRLRLLRERAS